MAAMALESVAQAIQGLGSTRVKIDTGAFSLHYRATTTVFVAFGGLLYTTGLMVDPLQCQPAAGSDGASTPVINAFCWSAGTYSLKPTDGTTEESGIPHGRRHSYYSWAALLLIVQGLLFYLPHWIWNALEGRTIASIVQDTSNRMFDQQTASVSGERHSVLPQDQGTTSGLLVLLRRLRGSQLRQRDQQFVSDGRLPRRGVSRLRGSRCESPLGRGPARTDGRAVSQDDRVSGYPAGCGRVRRRHHRHHLRADAERPLREGLPAAMVLADHPVRDQRLQPALAAGDHADPPAACGGAQPPRAARPP
ncbi:uncharacterized protein LOC122366069 [Amphibalanus amphitrite]|uniref:uncharacterized protein LOC122366069 n=1 Tax=Amphibalanus amphitrite TaxID=1232801 RepID=UPI001C911ADB|nr:uncharacterized protein LOC122366069 [Amphibalanus amphitrite]XP_043193786.1 uncharacterized protein LOC122366069 [Amphibalanus amphitrite]